MSKVYEIKFFKKEGELFAALFAKPSIFFPEFWIDNIKASKIGFAKLPENIELKRKYKIEQLGLKPFEFSKEGFAYGISDFVNRVTQESNKENNAYITNNYIKNNYEQNGNFGIGHMNGGNISDNTKVAGTINEAQQLKLREVAEEIQVLLQQLEQTYNTNTTTGKMAIASQAIELIDNNQILRGKILDTLKADGITALKQLINQPTANFVFIALEDWQKTKVSSN